MIKFDNVAYSYGGAELFSNVDLSLDAGSFHFLTGPSGSGKTTLLKLCYRELQATAGTVSLFGAPARQLDRNQVSALRQHIGVVHQDCQFVNHLSIEENITLPLTVSGQSTSHTNIKDLLHWVGLSAQAKQLPAELSGGERQRAALARAIIMSPDIIIADEPTGNIDWDMSQRLLMLLIELNRMGKTILIATHDMNLIRASKSQITTRVLRLFNRKLYHAGAEL